VPVCPDCDVLAARQDPAAAAHEATRTHEGATALVTYAVRVGGTEEFLDAREQLLKAGYRRLLVQGVARDVNGLGYFGFAYYVENKDKLKAVPIVNEKGQAVAPSMEAVFATSSAMRRILASTQRPNEEDAVLAQGLAAANRSPYEGRANWQGARDQLSKRREPSAAGSRVGDGNEEPDRSLLLIRDRLPLQLSRPHLRLEIHQGALDLDVDDLSRTHEDEVGGASIAGSHRYLEPRAPVRMRGADDRLSQHQLPGIPEPHRRDRVQPPAELVPAGRRQPASDLERDVARAELGLAGLLLAHTREPADLRLRQARGHPSDTQFPTERGSQIPRARTTDSGWP